MDWKEALGISQPNWGGIAKHLAEVTKRKLEKEGRTDCDLTNYLRSQGNDYIELSYVQDYLSGEVSFGCFFPQFRELLNISPRDVFRGLDEEGAKKNLDELDKYLTNTENPEFLITFMKHKPGEELRNYVAELLRKKRADAIDKPYHTLELGLDEEEFREKEKMWENIKTYLKSLTDQRLLQAPEENPSNLPQQESPSSSLYNLIVQEMKAMRDARSYAYYVTSVIPGSRIVMQPASKRGKKGVTIDFLYPGGDYFDKMISECPPKHQWLKDEFMGLDAWKEAYTSGTFSTLIGNEGMQQLSNICASLEMGVNEFIPLREFKESERYEFHQRWVFNTGGYYHAGPHIKGPQEVERKKRNRPDPVSRSEFEEDAYRINSGLLLMLGLYDFLPELVKDNPNLKI